MFKGYKAFVQKDLDVQIGGFVAWSYRTTTSRIVRIRETVDVTGAPPDLQTDSA